MITKQYLFNLLRKEGFLLNKSALFYYLNDYTDLINLKFKDIKKTIFPTINREDFIKLNWNEILKRLN